jgi:hypothetical protein
MSNFVELYYTSQKEKLLEVFEKKISRRFLTLLRLSNRRMETTS